MNLGHILIIISAVWVASEIGLNLAKRSSPGDERSDRSSLRILWIVITLAVTAGNLLRFRVPGHFGHGSPVFIIAGMLMIVIGIIVRWVAIIQLNRQFTVDVSIVKDHRVVKSGLYRLVRHPSYSGALLSFLGLGLCFSNYLVLVVIFVPILFAFRYRIRVEEKALADAFGQEYLDYCQATKRLVPGIY
jgi:protein-S-isoprenylcysteine O-methyltransferase Ste14